VELGFYGHGGKCIIRIFARSKKSTTILKDINANELVFYFLKCDETLLSFLLSNEKSFLPLSSLSCSSITFFKSNCRQVSVDMAW
jgi:hypothetical protein